jgi:hypothetical protein
MNSRAVRELFRRLEPIEPVAPVNETPIPYLLAIFDRLEMPMAYLARALGVTDGCISQWRSRLRPIPRKRRIELVALLGVIMVRYDQLADRMVDPVLRDYLERQASLIHLVLEAEMLHPRRGLDNLMKFDRDVLEEMRRVYDTSRTSRSEQQTEANADGGTVKSSSSTVDIEIGRVNEIGRVRLRIQRVVKPIWAASDQRRRARRKAAEGKPS